MIRCKLNILFFLLSFSILSIADGAPTSKNCQREKEDFKKLYIGLQQYLNYEGRDAKIDKNKLILEKHPDGTPYGGKEVEKILYTQYQNALKKVAKVLQKDDGSIDIESLGPEYAEVINYFKNNDTANLTNVKMNELLIKLQKKSYEKFNNEKDKKYLINSNDFYLLQKLLIHADDHTVRLENPNKKLSKIKKAEYEKIRLGPLQLMINALKGTTAGTPIGQKTNLELDQAVDSEAVIKKSINDQMKLLQEWIKNNSACIKEIKKNPNFIQSGIQATNYNKFIDLLITPDCNKNSELSPLGQNDFDNIQALLQFINANQKHGKIDPKAETGFKKDELKKFADKTFEKEKKPETVTPPSPETPAACTAETNTQACCDEKNRKIVDGVPSPVSTKEFKWNEEKKTCDKNEEPAAEGEPEAGGPEGEPAAEIKRGTPTPTRLLQMPQQGGPLILRGLH